MAYRTKHNLGTNEFKTKNTVKSFFQALLCEFLGIFLLNFFGCGAYTQATEFSSQVPIALTFGFVVFVSISIFGHISGGHINPAVTMAMLVSARISLIRAISYIIVQCLGAAAGTATLSVLIDKDYHNGLGHTSLANNVSSVQGLFLEFFLGLILVLTVFGNCDPHKLDSRFTAALAIGISVTVGHLGVVKYTGASMNPARTFGTAIFTNWNSHWVYWVGPILGGMVAAFIYNILLDISREVIVH